MACIAGAGSRAGRAAFWIATITVIVFVESARRDVRVDFAERKIGERVLPARPAVLPIKIDGAGHLAQTTVAPWILFLPLAFLTYIFGPDASWIAAAYKQLQPGSLGHVILDRLRPRGRLHLHGYVVDPEHAAESFAKQGGMIPGVAPGEATADYLDRGLVDDGGRSRLPEGAAVDSGGLRGLWQCAAV